MAEIFNIILATLCQFLHQDISTFFGQSIVYLLIDKSDLCLMVYIRLFFIFHFIALLNLTFMQVEKKFAVRFKFFIMKAGLTREKLL
jgi:hypothetical protein